ncbi:MAG: 30S ribosomal protein S20 [Ignavibacteria bacterium]|nr:30S ribosomal protein S20 [Ignavibacteria bacterium]
MANHKSAKKRISVSEKRRVINKASLSKMKTLTKKVFEADKAGADATYKEAVSYIDKMVAKGRVHRNTAARRKSQLTKHVASLEA